MKSLRDVFTCVGGKRTDNKRQRRVLRLEPLEDRMMLSAAPVAVDDLVMATVNAPLTIDYLTLNDSDADGDALSVQSTTMPSHGTLVDNGNGIFTYTPLAGYRGQDAFTYVVTDNADGTDTATVELIVSDVLDVNAARTQILSGVSTLINPGGPGRIAAFGPQAAVIGNDQNDGSIIAAATWGEGRVIAMNDHQWLQMSREAGSGTTTAQYYENSIAWLAGTTNKNIKIVTYSSSESDNRDWLIDHGYTHVVSASSSNLATHLSGAAVFAPGWLGSNVSSTVLNTVADYTRDGGGLFIADYGTGYDWWWGKEIHEAPGNVLLREAGIGFPNDTSAGLNVSPATGHINADVVLDMLDDSSGYTQAQLDEGGRLLDFMFDVLPPGDSLLAQLDERFWDRIDSINPTPSTPVSDPFDIALLNREAQILRDLPATEVTAHRTAEAVYGVIPADAPRVTEQVTLDTTHGRWHATGLYAAPGELVTVTVPRSLGNEGYRIRINAHKDWVGRDTLERLPYVHRSYDITSTTMQVANAFGGSIFIDFGGGAYDEPPNLGDVDITIAGAVKQPYFVLGEHTDQEWNDTLRDQPAPYAVFVSDNLMFSQRSSESTLLNEPTALMTWWNEVVRLEDQLANRGEERTSPEFINVDVQQSAGAAHSGYPVQAYDKYWGNLADYNKLTVNGSWGDFHELGHNHQRGWWTFSGDTEVTVNVFSTYALRNQASNPTTGWWWTTDPEEVMQRAMTAVGTSSTYSGISSVADRLAFWVQLADGFDWETYENVLGDYEFDNANNPSALPSDNQEEKDQWLVRWSNEVGYNMEMFMVDTWGLQVSQSAIDSVDHLPDWMPVLVQDDFVTVDLGQTVLFNVLDNDMTMNGVPQIDEDDGFTQPAHGQLVDNGNGNFTYTPNTGFSGTDVFQYTAESSVGNTVTGTVELAVYETVSVNQPIDTYIHQALPNNQYSTSNILKVDGNDSGGEVQTLLRYEDLIGPGTNQIPEHATIHSATLQLRVVNEGDAIELYRMLDSWEETDTWNSRMDGIQTDGIEAEKTPDVATGNLGTGIVTIDVATSLQAWADHTGTNHGWAILPTDNNGVQFYSAEGPLRPQLVVSYSYVEPRLGDFNEDGATDSVDLGIWSDGFAGFPDGDATLNDGDADGDGDVDGNDFLSWQRGYGSSTESGAASAVNAASYAGATASNGSGDAFFGPGGGDATDAASDAESLGFTRNGLAGSDDGRMGSNRPDSLSAPFGQRWEMASGYYLPGIEIDQGQPAASRPVVEEYWNNYNPHDDEVSRSNDLHALQQSASRSGMRYTSLPQDNKAFTKGLTALAQDRTLRNADRLQRDALETFFSELNKDSFFTYDE